MSLLFLGIGTKNDVKLMGVYSDSTSFSTPAVDGYVGADRAVGFFSSLCCIHFFLKCLGCPLRLITFRLTVTIVFSIT